MPHALSRGWRKFLRILDFFQTFSVRLSRFLSVTGQPTREKSVCKLLIVRVHGKGSGVGALKRVRKKSEKAGVKTVTIPQTFANNPFARRTDFQIAGRVGRKIDRMMVSIAYRY